MNDPSIQLLLNDLKSEDAEVRDRATQELWRIWFLQKGAYGLELLERAQMLQEQNRLVEAEAALSQIINDQPDFAEAWNRRAVLYYLKQQYRKSLQDCQKVVELNPVHFGAWHGMGLCHAALGEYPSAIRAFRKALDIQPHAIMNQRLILECTARLSG
ncbi:MAG: tetratricopeptide repeat protein [Synechococcales cyanobacterium T60_A2020_003]|nr:tetratricopeptide repeat protein [Synechococcales cyanobacterium T60_A2020_003]